MALILNGDTGVTYPVIAGGTSALQSSAGKVLQVLQATKTDVFSVTGSDFTDVTGLSISITPSNSSNKILILTHLHIDAYVGGFTLNRQKSCRCHFIICIYIILLSSF